MNNPLISQGVLNRVLTEVLVTSYPALTVTASYMAKSQAQLTFDGDFGQQIGTATGIVQSPPPYVMAQVVINLIRSQYVANAYLTQVEVNAILGTVVVTSDSPVLETFELTECIVKNIDPGAFDGQDPTMKITITGKLDINSILWTGTLS